MASWSLQDIDRLHRDLTKEEEAKNDLQSKLRKCTGERDTARKSAKEHEAAKIAAQVAVCTRLGAPCQELPSEALSPPSEALSLPSEALSPPSEALNPPS